MIAAGSSIDRYDVTGVLGEGGMARVYAVRHRSLGSEHALKVLTLGGADLRARLVEEGRIQASLRHPNVVTVTDLVDVDGHPGLVMERVRGPSLDGLLAGGRLPPDDVDTIARGILDGVSAAHAHGLVHRDLKPGNVLLERVDGRWVPKVADFGLARIVDADGRRTRTGSTMGTPWYMAPEQVRNARHAGPESDVFSLGAILYEMVTGQRAFDGDDLIALFESMRSDRYVDPASLAPEAPSRWIAAIRGALVGDRQHRVPTVAGLRALWDGTSVPAPRVDATWLGPPGEADSLAPASPPARLRTILFASAILVVLTVGASGVAAAGIVWWLLSDPPTAADVEPAWEDPSGEAPGAVADVPGSAPSPVALPTPDPAPEPVVAMPSSPPPTPVEPAPSSPPPGASTGTIVLDARFPMSIRDASGVPMSAGALRPGTYRVLADFGEGMVEVAVIELHAGSRHELRCNRLKNLCIAEDAAGAKP